MENGNYIGGEKEINLVGMIAYAMRKWKTLLLSLLIGAVIFAGVYAVSRPGEGAMLAQEEALRVRLETLHENACEMQTSCDSLKAYRENSVYLNLDASNVSCGELQYYVANGEDAAYTAQMLAVGLQDTDVLMRVGEAVGLDTDVRYIREIVTTSSESVTAADTEGGAVGYLVTANVLGSDESSCTAALGVLQEEAERIAGQHAQGVVRPTLKRVYVYRDADIEAVRDDVDKRITTLENSLAKLKSGFTADELAYYDAEYLKLEGAQKPDLFSGGIDISSLLKWAVIGFALAGICWVCVIGAEYLLKDWISCTDDVRGYGIPLIAHVEKEKRAKRDIFCTLADKMEMACDVPYNAPAYVRESIGLMEQETIAVLGDERIVQQMDEILSDLPKVCVAGMVYSSPEALLAAKKADGVILLLEKNHSKHGEIRRQLERCSVQKIKILGAIVIG